MNTRNNRPWSFFVGVVTALVLGGLLVACDSAIFSKSPSGTIEVTTTPAGARVSVNRRDRGVSPLTVRDMQPGQHLVEISMEGYRDARRTVTLLEGQNVLAALSLEPVRGLLLVETDPPGADIYIENAHRGKTPRTLHDIPMGTHRIQLQAEGYFPREVEVAVEDRRPRLVSTALVPDSAVLVVESDPEGAVVRIDGSNAGTTPARIERVKTGEVVVEIVADGYVPYRREMRLRAGEIYRVEAQLDSQPGSLTVVSDPTGARIFINDEYRDETPATITGLDLGLYDVRVERRGFAPQNRSVTVAAGSTRTEEFRLLRDSGKLILVTEPAGVQVYIDGEPVGITRAGDTDVVSEPLEIDFVERGDRRLQLARRGYTYEPKTIRVQTNQVLSLHERMERMFIPDTIVRTGPRASDTYTGVLIRRHPSGDVELETRPGIRVVIPADEIRSVEAIRDPTLDGGTRP